MPLTCIVVNCGSRADRDKVSFFAVPKVSNFKHAVHLNELSAKRRQKWISAIKRDDLTDSILRYEKVCSKHFISGKPADLKDIDNPDWAPNQNMGYASGPHLKRKSDLEKLKRARKRSKQMDVLPVDDMSAQPYMEVDMEHAEESSTFETGSSTQTDFTQLDLNNQSEQLKSAQKTIKELSQKLKKMQLTYSALKDDSQKCHYYTGLDFPILRTVFEEIEEFVPSTSVSALEPFQQVLLTFMKLRNNFPFKDLAYRFGISQTTCSSYFNLIIDIMYKRFQSLIIWPDREEILINMPTCFKEVFHDKTTVIIDCFEVFIEKPSSLIAQQQCWSNYKHHNTIKFLIGITPQGTISYISNAWGGRTSDKQIVERSTFLSKINPQDVVLADRGFAIKESLAVLNAHLVIPAFTKQKKQLVPIEIEETRKIAHVRIHVERIIGAIKSKFLILKGPIPISMLTHTSNELNILDKIVVVCSAMINICPPVVPL